MAVQLPRSLSNLLIRGPILEVFERLEAEERAELVHGAHAPLAALLHRHNFDDFQDLGCAPRAVRACYALGGVLEDTGEIVVAELAVWAALDAREFTGPGVGIDDGRPGTCNGWSEVGQRERIERLVDEELSEQVFSPLDVFLGGGRVPLQTFLVQPYISRFMDGLTR